MTSSSTTYDFGTVQLDSNSKKILSKVIHEAISHSQHVPPGSIFFGRYVKGIRPNFLARNKELQCNLYEIAHYLSNKLQLENPILSVYGDLHSCFSVTWHEDRSTFNENLLADMPFFEEKRKLLKFYIKLPLSYLDLSIKSNSRISYIKSSCNEISYFDVRCTHRTYVTIPKQLQHSFVFFLSNLVNRLLSVALKRLGGINWPKSSNLYFLIYEDCEIFREYEKRELSRAYSQLS